MLILILIKKLLKIKNENKLRIKEVRDLINKGLSIEEIADVLKVGKGEILLIKELYLKLKKIVDFLSDRRVLAGIGIGIVISTLLMINTKIQYNLSRYKIEMKAREYGMEYKDEHKVIEKTPSNNSNNKDVKK